MIVARTSTPQVFSHLAKNLACAAFTLTVLIAAIVFFGTYLVIGRTSYQSLPVMITIGGIILSSGIFAFVVYLLVRRFLQPFEFIVTELNKVAKGDLTVDFSTAARDSLGVLALNIQDMLRAFKGVVEKIIVTTINNVVTFGEEFRGLVGGVSESSVAQSNQAGSIATAANQMSGAAEAVRHNTEVVRRTTEAAMETAREGAVIAADTADILHTVGSSTSKLAEHVEELHSSVQEIEEIVDVIKEITDQTNLLALNAAIEAARAGGAGRGFAVVADEVRRLAERTLEATAEISHRVSRLKQESATTKTSMDESIEIVTRMHEKASGLGASLASIVDSVRQVDESMILISSSMREQSDASALVAKSIGDVAVTSAELKEMSFMVERRVKDFESTAEKMLELVGVFKTDLHLRAQQFVDKLRTNSDLLSLNPARIESFLISQLKEHPWVELIYVTDAKGRQLTGNIATSGVDENVRGKDWSKRPWFVEPATTGKAYLSGLYRSVATNDFCFTASVPVCDGHTISGVIGADINFRFLSELESGKTFGAAHFDACS